MFEKSITALVKIAIVSPMDDFVVFPTLSFLDSFGISCHFLIAGFIYIASAYFFYCISIGTTSYSLVPNKYQAFVTQIFVFVQSLVSENVKENKGIKYFPIFFFLFLYIATLNVMGLASYTFAITCQLSVTICLSLTVFFSSCIYGFITHGKRFVAIFLPTGTPFLLSFLLIPVEIISFFFWPISLSVWLFANTTSGHFILKLLSWGAYILSRDFLLYLFPFVLWIFFLAILFLEFCVGLIQAYVFTVLTCTYINDALNMH